MFPVISGGRGNDNEALLLYNKGVSMMMPHSEVADQLIIKQTQKAEFMVMVEKPFRLQQKNKIMSYWTF